MPMRILFAAGIVASLAMPAAAQSKETERVDRTIPFQSGGTIVLKNFSGDVRISGTGGGQVVLKAVRTATRERLDRIKLDIRVDGSTLRIDANKRDRSRDDDKDNVVETDFELAVPAQTNLEVDAFSSDVTIDGVEGRQKLHTFSGSITVKNGTGPFTLNSFSGSIDVDVDVRGDAGNRGRDLQRRHRGARPGQRQRRGRVQLVQRRFVERRPAHAAERQQEAVQRHAERRRPQRAEVQDIQRGRSDKVLEFRI